MPDLVSLLEKARVITRQDPIPLLPADYLYFSPGCCPHPGELLKQLQDEIDYSDDDQLPARFAALNLLVCYLEDLEWEIAHPEEASELYDGFDADSEQPTPEELEKLRQWARTRLLELSQLRPSPPTITESRILSWEVGCAIVAMNAERLRDLLHQADQCAFILPERRLLIEGALLLVSATPSIRTLRSLVGRCEKRYWDQTFLGVYVFFHFLGLVEDPDRDSLVGHASVAGDLLQSARQRFSEGLSQQNLEPDSVFRFLLGVCELALGKPFGAASEWERCMHEPGEESGFIDFMRKFPGCLQLGPAEVWGRALPRPAARAYEEAGKIAKAIQVLKAAVAAEAKKGDFGWLARLHASQTDYQTAYQYILQEQELDPSIGADPITSTLLAVTGATGLPALEDYFRRLASEDPAKGGMAAVQATLSATWWAYDRLDTLTAKCFCYGVYWSRVWSRVSSLAIDERSLTIMAIGWFAAAVEKELHVKVFQPFRKQLPEGTKSAAAKITDEMLSDLKDFVRGAGRIDLGAMVFLLRVQPGEPVSKSLFDFLRGNFREEIRNPMYDKIRVYRNEVAHGFDGAGEPKDITLEHAADMMRLCQDLLSVLHLGKPSVPGKPYGKA